MPLTLVQSGNANAQSSTSPIIYGQWVYEDSDPAAKISSVTIEPNGTIVIRFPHFTEDMLVTSYGRYRNIFTVFHLFNQKTGMTARCEVGLCNESQLVLLREFITKHISEDFFETIKPYLPVPRQDTPEEIQFKANLEKFQKKSPDASQFEVLLSEAEEICKTKQAGSHLKSWDALWILAKACLDMELIQEAFDAFSAIPKDNWYRDSADYEVVNMSLENIELSGLDDNTKHETLRKHLIEFFKNNRERVFEADPIIWKLIALAGCKTSDFTDLNSMRELKNPQCLILKFADSYYQLHKKNPTFKTEVSFAGLFDETPPDSSTHLDESDENANNAQLVVLTPEQWSTDGDLDRFINDVAQWKQIQFINQSQNPHFFTRITINVGPTHQYMDVVLPGVYEAFPDALDEKYEGYRYTMSLCLADNTECRLSVKNFGKLTEKQLEKLFEFLQNKIPTDILQKLKQCIVPRKATPEEEAFELDLEKLNTEATNFAYLLELAKKIKVTGDNEPLFQLGKMCLTLQLFDKAYEAFSDVNDGSSGYHDDYKSVAHFEISKILLSKIQLDPKKTDDENHAAIGVLLKNYFEQNFDEEESVMVVEKIRLYAGLPVTPQPPKAEPSDADAIKQLELILELAERIYLVKNSMASRPEVLDLNNNNSLIVFSSAGQQVVDPNQPGTALSNNEPKKNENGKKNQATLN